MTLGEYITNYRKEHDLSGRAFAALVGLSPQYITNLERGLNNEGNPVKPTIVTYQKIAEGTGLTEIELLSMLNDVVWVNPQLTEKQMEFIRLVSLLSDQEVSFLLAQVKGLLQNQQFPDGQE